MAVLEVYNDATPNGLKVSIALEELALQYAVHRVFLGGEQLTPEFTKLNPNQKIPVLVDSDEDIVLTESGAILVYLAEKTGKLLPKDFKGRIKTIELVFNQMSSLGPMLGQLLVFRGPWQNKFPEVSNRYFKEVTRVFGVLNTRLEGQPYFVGDEFTIADIAYFPWVAATTKFPMMADIRLAEYPNLKTWMERVVSRPAVQKGLTIPEPFPQDKQFEGFIRATVGLGDLYK
jgi:GSH-dependent disulfide-bond oxidoreductase